MKDSDFLTWIADRMVHHHSENEDFDYIHRLRKLATKAKEKEEEEAHGLRVDLNYFTETGKWYSEGNYRTRNENLWEIWEEVQGMLDNRKLPGLIDGHSAFCVTVDVAQHPHRHPHLIYPMTMTSKIAPQQEAAAREWRQDHNIPEVEDVDSSGMDRERRSIGPSEATLLGEGSTNVTVQSPTTGPFSGEVENTSDTDGFEGPTH